jgi:hypothetical protein
MDGEQNSLNLLRFFVDTFSIDAVYQLGWYAARDWMVVVTGVLVGIAIAIRMSEERIAAFSARGKSDYLKVFTNVVLVAMGIGMYFVVAGVAIDFFNAIYGVMDSGTMQYMAQEIDKVTQKLFALDLEVGWSIIIESVYIIFSLLAFAVTYCMLIFMTFAMRLAHAMLVSFVIFWGAVALPMSITTGLKQLTPFKTLAILCLIWPIVDAFLMYLIGGAFINGLDNANLAIDTEGSISTSKLLFYLVVFSIINLFLIATTFSAPFIAQGLANGTGNVTGMIGSFGAAGLAAGGIAGSKMMESFNTRGGQAAGKVWGKSAEEGGMGLKAAGARALVGSDLANNLSSNKQDFTGGSGSGSGGKGPAGPSGSGPGQGSSMADASRKAPTPGESPPKGPSSGPSSGKATAVGDSGAGQSEKHGGVTEEDQIREGAQPQEDQQGDLADQQEREKSKSKKQQQDRRGAIIQQNKGKT